MPAILPIGVLLLAQVTAQQVAVPPPLDNPPWSTDLLDTNGITRFELVTRVSFSDGDNVFSSESAWAYEARANLRLTPGVSLAVIAPFGVVTGHEEDTRAVFGNAGSGISFGGAASKSAELELRIGGGFDVYFPTSVSRGTTVGALGLLSALRGYEAQLYIPYTLSFRGRGQVEATMGRVTVGAELGLVPAISLAKSNDGFFMLLGVAGRVSFDAAPFVEPYLEVGGSTSIAGIGEVRPPLILTPGVRFHVLDAFDPALFISFNFIEGSAVMFGLDLASAIRHSAESKDRSNPRNNDILEGNEEDFEF